MLNGLIDDRCCGAGGRRLNPPGVNEEPVEPSNRPTVSVRPETRRLLLLRYNVDLKSLLQLS